jgi:pyruvate dehydrogenase E2 component (dihydrolipoamide acetyltransferase)
MMRRNRCNLVEKVGDTVAEGDILAEIETDKATMEFESFNAGTLLYVGIEEGNTAPVDSLLAIIGPAGTDVAGIATNYKAGGQRQLLLLQVKEVETTAATDCSRNCS